MMPEKPFKPGATVRSRKVGGIKSFIGIITERRGNGFQVLNPQDGKVYQRDRWELSIETASVKEGAA